MMNPTYHFRRMRELLDEYEPSRERSLAATKLDECELWLARCTPTAEAVQRDQVASLAAGVPAAQPSIATAAAHSYTAACAGHHPIGEPCPPPPPVQTFVVGPDGFPQE